MVETINTVELNDLVEESVKRSLNAFNAGDSEFFEEFASDATIFVAESGQPIKGREAYRERFGAVLASQSLRKTILEKKVQVVGTKAVVTQKAEITNNESTAVVSQTLVYGATPEGLKILHSQTSLLSQPSIDLGMGAVRVVSERIATVPAVFGVAQ